MTRAAFPVAVHLFLHTNNQLLMLRRYRTGYEDGNYSVVAGHLDGGEDVYAAMIREAGEEAGILLQRPALEIVQVMHRKSAAEERVDYFLACNTWEGEVRNMEPDKCDDLCWCPWAAIPDNTIGYVRAAIENYRNGVAFSLYGW